MTKVTGNDDSSRRISSFIHGAPAPESSPRQNSPLERIRALFDNRRRHRRRAHGLRFRSPCIFRACAGCPAHRRLSTPPRRVACRSWRRRSSTLLPTTCRLLSWFEAIVQTRMAALFWCFENADSSEDCPTDRQRRTGGQEEDDVSAGGDLDPGLDTRRPLSHDATAPFRTARPDPCGSKRPARSSAFLVSPGRTERGGKRARP